MIDKVRYQTVIILERSNKYNTRLSQERDRCFRNRQLRTQERQRITYLTQEITRWQGRLDYWLGQALVKPLSSLQKRILMILRMALFELHIDQTIPAYAAVHSAVELTESMVGKHAQNLVNAVLRKAQQINTQIPESGLTRLEDRAAWLSFPAWLLSRWEQRYGIEPASGLCEHFNRFGHLTVRRNRSRISEIELCNRLDQLGIQYERVGNSNRFYRLKSGAETIYQDELFLGGLLSFQDRAAGAVVEILDPLPGEIVLDVCAAPGTKAVYMAEIMTERTGPGGCGKVYASDQNKARVQAGVQDMQRHGMTNIEWSVKDATRDVYPLADAILIDAPCTGTGVIGRRPDIKWRRREQELPEMGTIQLNMLTHMEKYLKAGGRLVYATCSLEPEENWDVIKAFLKLTPHYRVEKISHLLPGEWITAEGALETFPSRDFVDGIFAVRLRKS